MSCGISNRLFLFIIVQIPYYWPCSQKNPDNVEYAIYLSKRLLRNKQRHALEDYETVNENTQNNKRGGVYHVIVPISAAFHLSTEVSKNGLGRLLFSYFTSTENCLK